MSASTRLWGPSDYHRPDGDHEELPAYGALQLPVPHGCVQHLQPCGFGLLQQPGRRGNLRGVVPGSQLRCNGGQFKTSCSEPRCVSCSSACICSSSSGVQRNNSQEGAFGLPPNFLRGSNACLRGMHRRLSGLPAAGFWLSSSDDWGKNEQASLQVPSPRSNPAPFTAAVHCLCAESQTQPCRGWMCGCPPMSARTWC